MSATKIGVLYSTATGVALRTINPDNIMGDAHLDWLKANLPDGTELIMIDKKTVGADEKNCPHLDVLIPHVKDNHGINLQYGVTCSVIDENGKVVENVIACPVLYQAKLDADAVLVNDAISKNQKPDISKLAITEIPDAPVKPISRKLISHITGDVGDVYDEANKTFIRLDVLDSKVKIAGDAIAEEGLG